MWGVPTQTNVNNNYHAPQHDSRTSNGRTLGEEEHQRACASCGEVAARRLVSSLACTHQLCATCLGKLPACHNAGPWMNCGVCRIPCAFHTAMTETPRAGIGQEHHHETWPGSTPQYGWEARTTPYAASVGSTLGYAAARPTPSHPHYHHVTTSYASWAPSSGALVSPHAVDGTTLSGGSYPPSMAYTADVAWQTPPSSTAAAAAAVLPYHHAWSMTSQEPQQQHPRPRSPMHLQVSPLPSQHVAVALDASPSIHSGLVPPDIDRMASHDDEWGLATTATCRQGSTSPPATSMPRKRARTPPTTAITKRRPVRTAMPSYRALPSGADPTTPPMPNYEHQHKPWLTCRVCGQAVAVACQKLVTGPSPDDERLWPQVRLGKRLAASLRQHNQLHHPAWFMWNVKGRSTTLLAQWTDGTSLDDAEAVAQVALGKALESAFEQLPHVPGVDTYGQKEVFQRRLLRRLGFAHAYLSYTSSEWTKWQQWKKERYSRTQIQAVARRLLERYESNLLAVLEQDWWRLADMSHQEQLDVFQNLFVVPQCIRAGLEEGRLLLGYGGEVDRV
jgi:hypothetical protein